MAAGLTDLLCLADAKVRRGAVQVVQSVSFSIARGSCFGVIGANGSGKTTLLRAIGGRLPFAGGSCTISGEEVAQDRSARASQIGFAPPIETLPDKMRIADALALVGGDLDRAVANLGGLAEAMGIGDLLDRWIGDCSSGIRQRLSISLAFANGHDIVILDEPFNWLDPVVAFDIKAILQDMVTNGLTLVTALHDIPTLTNCCDAGILMSEGHAALQLSGEQLRDGERDLSGFERKMIAALRAFDHSTDAV